MPTLLAEDVSTRFVQPDDSPLVKNLAALWLLDPEVAAQVEILLDEETSTPALIEEDPQEALRSAEAVDLESCFVCILLGFGSGQTASRLVERTDGEMPLIIFEPDLRVVAEAIRREDLTGLLEAPHVRLMTTADPTEVGRRLSPMMDLMTLGLGRVSHEPSIRRDPAFFAAAVEAVDRVLQQGTTNTNTALMHGRTTLENVARNLADYATAPDLSRLKGAFVGYPAIIVAAGPSLQKNIDRLREAAGKAVIIAVQTSLRPLLARGIVPTFVTSIDYSPICTRFWHDLPPDLPTELVAEPKASSHIFPMHPGPLTLNGNAFAESVLAEMKLDKDKLPGSMTVAHLAFYLAQYLGCAQTIFVGQDLGHSGGLAHMPGTSYDDVNRPETGRFCSFEQTQWQFIDRDQHVLRRVPGWDGQPVYTELRLFSYLQRFEMDFANSPTQVIDATEGGAAKRGATPMPLAQAIEQFCTKPIPQPPQHDGPDVSRLPSVVKSIEKRIEEADIIANVSRRTLPLLEEIRDHADDQARVNRCIGKIDELRRELANIGRTYDLVAAMDERGARERGRDDRRLAASRQRLTPLERQRRQTSRDVRNVSNILAATEDFRRLMAETRDDIQSRLKAA